MCLRIANPSSTASAAAGGRAHPYRRLRTAPRGSASRSPLELQHRVIKVDDLVEPRPEEIALSGLPTFFRPHESPRRRPQAARESRPDLRTARKYSRSGAWEFFTEDEVQGRVRG